MLNQGKKIRFIIVGASAFLIQLLLTWYLLSVGIRAAVSVMCAFFVVFVFAYLAHKYWTFDSGAPYSRALPKYFLAQMLALTCGALLSELVANLLALPNSLIATLATVISAMISYYLSSLWVFQGD